MKVVKISKRTLRNHVFASSKLLPTLKWKKIQSQCLQKHFSEQRSLTNHLQSLNRNQKHYKCESSGKSFSEAVSLKKHITKTVHEGHKDYKCESCGK